MGAALKEPKADKLDRAVRADAELTVVATVQVVREVKVVLTPERLVQLDKGVMAVTPDRAVLAVTGTARGDTAVPEARTGAADTTAATTPTITTTTPVTVITMETIIAHMAGTGTTGRTASFCQRCSLPRTIGSTIGATSLWTHRHRVVCGSAMATMHC